MKWRNSFICWRGGKQAKREFEMDYRSVNRNKAVTTFQAHEQRMPPRYNADQYHNHNDDVEKWKAPHSKPRSVARPISTKRTSSSSAAGQTADTKSTQADSTETPSVSKSRPSHQSEASRQNVATREPVKRRSSRSPVKQRQATPKSRRCKHRN